MRRRFISFLGSASALCLLSSLAPVTQVARAQNVTQYLVGSFGMQFTGTVFLPAPFDKFNGPFARNGRVVFDGAGNFQAAVTGNYNGTVLRETFGGTYTVGTDGTFVLTIPNLVTPFLPAGVPNVFTFDGVLTNGGRGARVLLSGVSIGGQAQANVGSVITGVLEKQY